MKKKRYEYFECMFKTSSQKIGWRDSLNKKKHIIEVKKIKQIIIKTFDYEKSTKIEYIFKNINNTLTYNNKIVKNIVVYDNNKTCFFETNVKKVLDNVLEINVEFENVDVNIKYINNEKNEIKSILNQVFEYQTKLRNELYENEK